MNREETWVLIRDQVDQINDLLAQIALGKGQQKLMRQVNQGLKQLEQLAPFLPTGQLTDMLFHPHTHGLSDQPTGAEIAGKALAYRPLITPSPDNP